MATTDTSVAKGDITSTDLAEGDITSTDVTQEDEKESEEAPLTPERCGSKWTTLIWAYFTRGSFKTKAVCYECGRAISTSGGTTSNMKKHLQLFHQKQFSELLLKETEQKEYEETKRPKESLAKATKLYVGNLPSDTDPEELRAEFAKYGQVVECDVLRNFGFVHMSNEDEAKVAVESLNNFYFNGSKLSVQMSRKGGQQGSTKTHMKTNSSVPKATKLFVGNLSESVTSEDLRTLFETYGEVEECDVLKNYGFVHMSKEDEAKEAVESLHQTEFMDTKIKVEISKGGRGQCFSCGQHGHWSRECRSNMGSRSGSSSFQNHFGRQFDRGFPTDGSYRAQRMRPYPDMYDRRPLAPPRSSYRGYSDYGDSLRSTSTYMNSGNNYERDYNHGQYRRSQDSNTSTSYMWSSSNPNAV